MKGNNELTLWKKFSNRILNHEKWIGWVLLAFSFSMGMFFMYCIPVQLLPGGPILRFFFGFTIIGLVMPSLSFLFFIVLKFKYGAIKE